MIFDGFLEEIIEVLGALAPLLGILILFMIFLLRIDLRKVARVMIGILFAVVGFSLFLQGVNIAFLPAGQEVGSEMAGGEYRYWLIPTGFLLGFVATSAEPAVRVLTYEVEEETGGSIRGKVLLLTLSIGVGLLVAVAMTQILVGFPLWWVLLPGYILALGLAFITDKRFVSIAFDSGGVATGPMTVTFILAMAISVAGELGDGESAVMEGFGLVALVALAPILAVIVLGILFKQKNKQEDNENESN